MTICLKVRSLHLNRIDMFRTIDFDQFIKIENPYPIFVDYNRIDWNEAHASKYLDLCKYPEDYKEMLSDLLLLGKREVSSLIRWRSKITGKLEKMNKKNAVKKQEFADHDKGKVLFISLIDSLMRKLTQMKSCTKSRRKKKGEKPRTGKRGCSSTPNKVSSPDRERRRTLSKSLKISISKNTEIL